MKLGEVPDVALMWESSLQGDPGTSVEEDARERTVCSSRLLTSLTGRPGGQTAFSNGRIDSFGPKVGEARDFGSLIASNFPLKGSIME